MSARKNITSGHLRDLLPALAAGTVPMAALIEDVFAAIGALKESRAFLHFNRQQVAFRAEKLRSQPPGPLFGLPVSVKDLMDVACQPTTCGSGFYASEVGLPTATAPFVAAWEDRGALLVGKTHLNEFAYGITGENPWFGDCTIPDAPERLTGGSSSGAAASVLGGAACVALGTDTGGSLRVPAALCGLVSLRAPGWFPDHRGVFPLAHTFDALGWIQRYAGDVRSVAAALGFVSGATPAVAAPRIGMMSGALLDDVQPTILRVLDDLRSMLVGAGCSVLELEAKRWETAFDLFAPLQAREAFEVHQRWLARRAEDYSAPVQTRLRWGEGITPEACAELQRRRAELVAHMSEAFTRADLLVLPAAPLTSLRAGEDQSVNRGRIIRLTAPASLGNWPVLTIPWRTSGEDGGIGFQIIAPRGQERRLVEFADRLGRFLPGE